MFTLKTSLGRTEIQLEAQRLSGGEEAANIKCHTEKSLKCQCDAESLRGY